MIYVIFFVSIHWVLRNQMNDCLTPEKKLILYSSAIHFEYLLLVCLHSKVPDFAWTISFISILLLFAWMKTLLLLVFFFPSSNLMQLSWSPYTWSLKVDYQYLIHLLSIPKLNLDPNWRPCINFTPILQFLPWNLMKSSNKIADISDGQKGNFHIKI